MPVRARSYPARPLSADPPVIAYVSVSDVSRSEPEAVPVALLKLSSPEVSVKEKPARAARLVASSAPLMVAVSVWVEFALPSDTDRVKFSLTLVFAPSIALSSGT